MSGKMKKLICALLTGTMLLSSAGMLAFAADPDKTNANDAAVTETAAPSDATTAPSDATTAPSDATAAPETATAAPSDATAAPETATQAPVVSSKYDSDEYYKKALSLCQGLGIITGREDGNVDPEANVTRAEMAAIILRMLANSSTSTYQNIFTDVTSSHWAANTIQTASALGIINGYPEDKSFRPDNDVQYEQVAKMIVCAMNYHETADYYGGYPSGHLKVASDLNITKNAPGNTGVASERGVVIKMVYNALLADYNEPDGSEYGKTKYKAEKTLAEYAFDVKEGKGVLLGTEITSLTGSDYSKGQVCIRMTNLNGTTTEETFTTSLTNLEGLLASNITFYYEEEAGNDVKTLLAIAENKAKTETVTLDRDDVDEIEEFKGFDNASEEGTIKVHGTSAYKIVADPLVIYNGALVTQKEFTDKQNANTKKDDTRLYENIEKDTSGKVISADPISYNDFLKPEVGTIRLVDNDMDGKYDTVFIDSYETLLVASATAKSVTGKINNASASINVNEDENDLTIKTTISGMEAAPRNLKKNNVASLKRSLDDETIEFTVTGESFTGTIQSYSNDEEGMVITVGGEEYDVDKNAQGDCKTGIQAIFYTDMFGRVGYVESSSASRLQSGEEYGWLMTAYESENKEDVLVKIMTQDGKSKEFKFASSVDYWAPDDLTGSNKLSKKNVEAAVKQVLDNDEFPHLWVSTRHTDKGYTSDNQRPLSWEKSHSIRLVKFKANSSGELSRLYCAVNAVNAAAYYYDKNDEHVYEQQAIEAPYLSSKELADIKDSDALIVDFNSKAGSTLVGGMTGGYLITDDMIEFGVPDTSANMSKDSAYKVKSVVASTYNQRENGVADTWLVADMDGANPAVLIKYIADTSVPGSAEDMDNVGNTPAMVVEKILSGRDEDENVVYQIVGSSSGSSMSVTTNTATTMAELTGYNDRKYAVGETLWNADSTESLSSVLHKGDIIISDGTNILLYKCVEDVYNEMKAGNNISKYVAGSNTRNYFKFDKVTNYEIDDPAQMTIGNDTVSFDASKAMTTVEIDLSKSAGNAVTVLKDVSNVADLYTDGSDYAFARFADKGALQEIIIYRFLNMPE